MTQLAHLARVQCMSLAPARVERGLRSVFGYQRRRPVLPEPCRRVKVVLRVLRIATVFETRVVLIALLRLAYSLLATACSLRTSTTVLRLSNRRTLSS